MIQSKIYYVKNKKNLNLDIIPTITFTEFSKDYIMMEIKSDFSSMNKIHPIMTKLGFQHSLTPGHTIYHRFKQLSSVIKQFTRVDPNLKILEGMIPK